MTAKKLRPWRARPIPTPLDQHIIDRFWSCVDKGGDCWLWTSGTWPTGYGRFYVDKQQYFSQRISYALTHGSCPPDKMVCHKCDNPPCVNPDHLFLGSGFDNMRDMVSKGRVARGGNHGEWVSGEKNHRAKLVASQIVEIRRLRAAGAECKDIAKKFGIHRTNVSLIANGQRWKHIV